MKRLRDSIPVRAKFDKPITITSGYRSPELCEAIGSKPTSQHTKGEAADFELAGISNLQVALWIQNNSVNHLYFQPILYY